MVIQKKGINKAPLSPVLFLLKGFAMVCFIIQAIRTGIFQAYDRGSPFLNMLHYGQVRFLLQRVITPPFGKCMKELDKWGRGLHFPGLWWKIDNRMASKLGNTSLYNINEILYSNYFQISCHLNFTIFFKY